MFYSGTESQRVIPSLIRITKWQSFTVTELYEFSFMVMLAKGQASIGALYFCFLPWRIPFVTISYLVFHLLHSSILLWYISFSCLTFISLLSFIFHCVLLSQNRNRPGWTHRDLESLYLQGLSAFPTAAWITLFLFLLKKIYSMAQIGFHTFHAASVLLLHHYWRDGLHRHFV